MVWCGVLRTGFGGPLCAKKSRATFWPQSTPACDNTLEQFTDDSLSIAEMMLFVSFEGKKLHLHDAVIFS